MPSGLGFRPYSLGEAGLINLLVLITFGQLERLDRNSKRPNFIALRVIR